MKRVKHLKIQKDIFIQDSNIYNLDKCYKLILNNY